MTMLGTISAWTAVAMAAMFGVNAYFQFATGVPGWVFAATALALAFGGYRTLRKLSGGLRLLAGAWGLAAGQLVVPLTMPRSDLAAVAQISGLEIVFVAFALVGLALTVLHKESK